MWHIVWAEKKGRPRRENATHHPDGEDVAGLRDSTAIEFVTEKGSDESRLLLPKNTL